MQSLLSGFEQYLQDYSEGQVSPHTISAYVGDIRHFLILVDKHVIQINPEDVMAFVRHNSFRPPRDICSVSTRKRRLSSVKAFFQYLITTGQVTNSPVHTQRIWARKGKTYPSFLNPQEVDKLLEYCDHILLKTIILVLYGTGMRLSEFMTCKMAWLDLKTREIKVSGKGKKERYIPISKDLNAQISEYLHWRESVVQENISELFVSEVGGRLNKNHMEYLFRKLSSKSGIAVHPHKLRHSFATEAKRRGMPSETLQLILGHESVATTSIYTHIEPDVKAEFEKAFDNH